jgi:alpha-tubulin suppressor-like RCC1 family protein
MNARSIRTAALVASALPALALVVVVARTIASRLSYPMDVEWMEGGLLYEAHRLLRGQAIYAPVDQGYLPFPYAPFYVVALAGLGKAIGLGYTTGRLLSASLFAAASLAMAREVAKHWTGRLPKEAAAIASLGWIAASYPVVAGWYDLIRIDTLALTLVVLAATAVQRAPLSWARTLWVASLLTAAIFTKQISLAFAAWIALFVVVRDRRRGVRLAVSTAVLSLATLAAVQAATHGRFWFYCVTLLARHRVFPDLMLEAAGTIFGFAPFLAGVPVVLALLLVRRRLDLTTLFWAGLLGGAVAVSIVSYAKETAWLNVLLYAVFFSGPLTLLLVGDLARAYEGRARDVLVGAVFAASGVGLVVKRFDAAPFTVTADLRGRAEALNALLAGLDAPTLAPTSPFLAARVSPATPQLHTMAYRDALGAGIATPGLAPYVEGSGAGYLLVSECMKRDEYPMLLGRALDADFVFDHRLPDGPRDLPNLIGYPCAPQDLWRRRVGSPRAPRPALPEKGAPTAVDLRADRIFAGGAFPATAHACATSSGRLVCWGANDHGQVSPRWVNDAAASAIAAPVDGASSVAVGGGHTCAIVDGAVRCWGDDRDGQLGDDGATSDGGPVTVALPAEAIAIAAGANHTCAIVHGGALHCWGRNTSGQLGRGDSRPGARPQPVAALGEVVEVAVGDAHSCARDASGAVWCWGDGLDGQLGRRASAIEPAPLRVDLAKPAAHLALGQDATCAALVDGRVQCWGRNDHGQVGDGTTEWRPTPTFVAQLADAAQIAMGGEHACARSAGGAVSCWGFNVSGETAHTWTHEPHAPELVPALAGATDIAVGSTFGCARLADGAVRCWGKDDRGQLARGALDFFAAHEAPAPARAAEAPATATD